MKKAALVLGLTLLLASPVWASSVGVMASYWFSDDTDDAPGGGLRFQLDAGETWTFEFRGSVYDDFEITRRSAGPVEKFQLEAVPIDFGVSYNFNKNAQINPYLGFGGSYVLLESRLGGRLQDEFGWFALAGADFNFREEAAIFVEVIYRNIDATLEADDLGRGLNEELNMKGPAINVGIAKRW